MVVRDRDIQILDFEENGTNIKNMGTFPPNGRCLQQHLI